MVIISDLLFAREEKGEDFNDFSEEYIVFIDSWINLISYNSLDNVTVNSRVVSGNLLLNKNAMVKICNLAGVYLMKYCNFGSLQGYNCLDKQYLSAVTITEKLMSMLIRCFKQDSTTEVLIKEIFATISQSKKVESYQSLDMVDNKTGVTTSSKIESFLQNLLQWMYYNTHPTLSAKYKNLKAQYNTAYPVTSNRSPSHLLWSNLVTETKFLIKIAAESTPKLASDILDISC